MSRWRWFLLWAGWAKLRVKDMPGVEPFLGPSLGALQWQALAANLVNAGVPIRDAPYAHVKWYWVSEITAKIMNLARPLNGASYDPRQHFAGVWVRAEDAIVLSREFPLDERVVLHEMTHAITNGCPHTHQYFRPEWGNYTEEQPI